MTPEAALALLRQQNSWEDFASLATTIATERDMKMVTSLELKTIRQIPVYIRDTR